MMKTEKIKLLFLYDRFKACIKPSKMQYIIDVEGNLTALGEFMFIYFVTASCANFFYDNTFQNDLYKYFINDFNETMKEKDI